MEVKCFVMCFVFLSLSRNYQGHEIENAEELETSFKRNQASTNASNILSNTKLSPETFNIEPGKRINQNQNAAKKRKLDRAYVSSNGQPELRSHATKEVVMPINTLNGILRTNRKRKKLPRTVKNIPNQPKTGINSNLTAVPPKIDITLNHSMVTKNSTHNPENDSKKEGTYNKHKLNTILVEYDDDIEHSKNIDGKHRDPSLKSESNMLGNTDKNRMPKDNKLKNKTDEGNLKSNNCEIVTVDILKNKPIYVVNERKTPNNQSKTANDTISFTTEKDNLSPKSTNKDRDLKIINNEKSMSSNVENYDPFNEYDASESSKSNTKNVPENGNEKPKTVLAEASDKHDVKKNDSIPIKFSEKDANKTSKFNNTEQNGTIFKVDDEEIIQIDQPFRIHLNEDNIKNETSISISMLPNRSITIEKTNLEEIHETYHPNLYQNQLPEQKNTQNNWYKSNQNYGQECQYPYQYGSYQTIPYSNNGYNSHYNYNYPSYQYGQPSYGFESSDQNIELIEKGIDEIFEKDSAINIESPDVQPRNLVSDPISALSARYRQPSRHNIFENPLVDNGNIGMSMKDSATIEFPDTPLFRNLGKNTFKGSTYPNVQSLYMPMYGNLVNDEYVYGDIPQKENSFQKINFNKPNYQEYNQIQFGRQKNLGIQPLSKTQEQNIEKDNFGATQKKDSDSVYSKIETPTYYSFEQTPGYKDKIWRKWKNTRILINNLNKPITIEMEGLNRLKTPSYKKPISDGTVVDKKHKTNQVNQKQPMKLCTY